MSSNVGFIQRWRGFSMFHSSWSRHSKTRCILRILGNWNASASIYGLGWLSTHRPRGRLSSSTLVRNMWYASQNIHMKLGAYHGKFVFNVLKLAPHIDSVLGLGWMNRHNTILDFGTRTYIISEGLRFITLFASSQPQDKRVSPLSSSIQLAKTLRKGA